MRENAETEIEEELSLFKSNIKKDQNDIKKNLNNTSNGLKSKVSTFSQELKEAKKGRVQTTNSLMMMIETARSKFDVFT